MVATKKINYFCWKFCNAYCGFGGDEDEKPSLVMVRLE
jgi:hypothetical protein